MTFDARAIKLLEAGQHLTSVEHPGLRIEAYPDRRTWTYRYRSPVDHKLRQIKIGGWPSMSTHAAIAEWEKLRDIRDLGRDPAVEAKAAKAEARRLLEEKKAAAKVKPYTVADLCDDYWEGHIVPNRKPKGVTEIRRMFDKLLGELASVPAADVSRSIAFDFIKNLADRTPVLAGNMRTELGAAWDYGYDSGRLPDTCPNWWRQILRGKIRSKGKKLGGEHQGTAKRVLTPDEVGKLIRWLPNFTKTLSDVVTMYLWTVTRGAEICAMEGREVNKEADGVWWWVIPKPKTKNARIENATDLRVPLFGRALQVVLRRKELYGDGVLFPSKRKDGKVVALEQKSVQSTLYTFQPYCTTDIKCVRPRLTVSHWTLHDLRRTSRTLLASLGCPAEVAESIMGHVLPGIVGVYNLHTYDAERVIWLRRLSEHLETLAEV